VNYRWKAAKPANGDLSEASIGVSGSNLLNQNIRNSVSYTKDEVLMSSTNVRRFATMKY